MIDDEHMPADPDLDFVDSDLRLLAGIAGGRVTVIDDDGVSDSDVLVIVPALWRHAHEVDEIEG